MFATLFETSTKSCTTYLDKIFCKLPKFVQQVLLRFFAVCSYTLRGIASICFKFHFQTERNCFNLFQISFSYWLSANTTDTDPGVSGVSKGQKNCEESKITHWQVDHPPYHWVKSKTIIEKHQKLRKRIINQLLVNFSPSKNIF